MFRDDRDYQMFLELLKKYQGQCEIKTFAYCLLPDHLHLLVEMEKQDALSDFMHSLNNTYTKYFNGRYKRRGHLFRERFKAVLVEKENYLLRMTAYIHLNPEKVNLDADSKDYPYSTYQAYLKNNLDEEKWLSIKKGVEEVLRLLQGKDYVEFVRGMTEGERGFIQKKLQRGGILGSEEFCRKVKDYIQSYQIKGASGKIEAGRQTDYKLFFVTGGSVLIFIIGLFGVYFYFSQQKNSRIDNKQQTFAAAIRQAEDLNSTEWEIKLQPSSGGEEMADMLSFSDGKFASAKLNPSGYQLSNYSVAVEDTGRVNWETMQSSPEGTASWRGEIEQGKMKGILSLREIGKTPQDFSFISIGYRRKK